MIISNHVIRLLGFMVLGVILNIGSIAHGSDPAFIGEFRITIVNSIGNLINRPIKINSASTIWGSKDVGNGYEITSSYSSLADETAHIVTLDHIEDPSATNLEFAYAKYEVSIHDGGWKTIYFDVRDCDSGDDGGAGTNYSSPDTEIWYNYTAEKYYNHNGFNKDTGVWDESERIFLESSVGIWDQGNKDPATPRHFCFEGIDPPS